ncbi:hypothetical protein GCM10025795_31540 [Verticiella sediminum]
MASDGKLGNATFPSAALRAIPQPRSASVAADIEIGDDLPPGPNLVYSTQKLSGPDGAASVGFGERAVADKLGEIVSAKDYGAKGDGLTDDGPALSAMWVAIRARIESLGANSRVCRLAVLIPPGYYRIATSIDWTNAAAWNIQVHAGGAVLLGECTGKAVIDACNTRGLHVHGLHVHGVEASTPSCGVLLSPAGIQTCGNNGFSEFKTTGHFTVAPLANLGSETTAFYNCYFANNQVGGNSYSYVADARNRLGLTSDYVTLRAPGVAVSFTRNAFYSCHFRKNLGGDGVYLEGTNGWMFDHACYHLAFSGANFRVVQSASFRNVDLSIRGLFETAQAPGLDYCVRFIVEDGGTSAIPGFEFVAGLPHAKTAIFRIEGPDGEDLVAGGLRLRASTIKVGGSMASGGVTPKMFSGARLYIVGDIHCADGAMLDLSVLEGLHGTVYTVDATSTVFPASGSHAFTLYDEITLSGQVVRIGGAGGQVGLQGGSIPTLRAEGSGADYDLLLRGKGIGQVRFGTWTNSADAAVTGYITIKDAGGATRKIATIA